MSLTRRSMIAAVPLTIGITGCSAIQSGGTQTVKIFIFNVSNKIQPINCILTHGDKQLASLSLDVGATPDGDHYTFEAQFSQLQRGDNLQLTASLTNEPEDQLTNLKVSCSKNCLNRFTIRITEQSGLDVYGRSSSKS